MSISDGNEGCLYKPWFTLVRPNRCSAALISKSSFGTPFCDFRVQFPLTFVQKHTQMSVKSQLKSGLTCRSEIQLNSHCFIPAAQCEPRLKQHFLTLKQSYVLNTSLTDDQLEMRQTSVWCPML